MKIGRPPPAFGGRRNGSPILKKGFGHMTDFRKMEEKPFTGEEIRNAYRALEMSVDRFEKISDMVSKLEEKNVTEKDFLIETLENLVEILSEADYGSVSVLESGRWKTIAAIGHDLEILSGFDFSKEELYVPQNVEIVGKIYERSSMGPETRKAFLKGLMPYKSTVVAPLKIDGAVVGRITLDISNENPSEFTEETRRVMDSFSKLASSFLQIRKYAKENAEFQKKLILSLVKALEYYDRYTRGHSERVAELSSGIGEALGLTNEEKERLYWASIVHDVGKIFIPQTILNKNGKLSLEEFEQVKLHSVKGAELLDGNDDMKEITKIVGHHHERWDGKGYPDGLEKDEIPLLSRIITIADSYDAMTSSRPYREILDREEAFEELKRCSGTQFDPKLVKLFTEKAGI